MLSALSTRALNSVVPSNFRVLTRTVVLLQAIRRTYILELLAGSSSLIRVAIISDGPARTFFRRNYGWQQQKSSRTCDHTSHRPPRTPSCTEIHPQYP